MFEWISSTTNSMIVTLYPANITLNSLCAEKFNHVNQCMIGINKKDKQIAIKPITKSDLELNIYPKSSLHKISIGKGYGRISSKNIINEISNLLNMELNGEKFFAEYNEKEKMLIVDLNKKSQGDKND